MRYVHGIYRTITLLPRLRYLCFRRGFTISPGIRRYKLNLVILLVLCLCISHFVILNLGENEKDAANRNPDLKEEIKSPHVTSVNTQDTYITVNSIPLLWNKDLVFVHRLNGEYHVTDISLQNILEGLKENDKLALRKLSEFLTSMEKFDGATCLQPHTHDRESKYLTKHDQIDTAINSSQESSWCRFIKRKWSVNIRNTGPIMEAKLPRKLDRHFNASSESLTGNFTIEEKIVLQNCNIIQGPFVIRKTAFNRIGGLLDNLGKVTLLEFFLRSEGELKMAKLTNCTWTPEITREDRGTLKESYNVPEYASLANKHQILRIVTESRIEWTTCVANWKLCPEKPYVKPRDLPSIAAPICCSAVLGQMLADFTWGLHKLGLEYRLIYGTLLGAVRSQAIIPWTYDVDIAIAKSAIANESTFAALRNILGGLYYVGNSYMNVPRVHMLMPPYIEVDTAPFYDGPDDLEGNALFSDEIEEAVRGMLPVSDSWRARGYIDLYGGHLVWMNDSSLVTINNQTFSTVKQVEYELTNWYGQNYREPTVTGNWVGLSDAGTA